MRWRDAVAPRKRFRHASARRTLLHRARGVLTNPRVTSRRVAGVFFQRYFLAKKRMGMSQRQIRRWDREARRNSPRPLKNRKTRSRLGGGAFKAASEKEQISFPLAEPASYAKVLRLRGGHGDESYEEEFPVMLETEDVVVVPQDILRLNYDYVVAPLVAETADSAAAAIAAACASTEPPHRFLAAYALRAYCPRSPIYMGARLADGCAALERALAAMNMYAADTKVRSRKAISYAAPTNHLMVVPLSHPPVP